MNKGPGRPAFAEQDRLKSLAALKAIDYVVLSKYPTATNVINETTVLRGICTFVCSDTFIII